MKIRHWITASVLLLLLAAAIVGMVRTQQRRGTSVEVALPAGSQPAATNNQRVVPQVLVNQRPLQTARRLGTLAYTEEGKGLAHRAEKVADQKDDLAFLDACRAWQ